MNWNVLVSSKDFCLIKQAKEPKEYILPYDKVPCKGDTVTFIERNADFSIGVGKVKMKFISKRRNEYGRGFIFLLSHECSI